MSTLGEENRLLQAVGGRRRGTTQGRSDDMARMREASKGGLDGGGGLMLDAWRRRGQLAGEGNRRRGQNSGDGRRLCFQEEEEDWQGWFCNFQEV